MPSDSHKNRFDCTFGEDFLSRVPLSPGIYRFIDSAGQVIYVGKAKSLRRRLSQYRCAGRKKKHRRMRKVVASGASIEFEVTDSHLDACLLEIAAIQSLRPKLNITSAFSFLYPYLAVGKTGCQIAMTTVPADLIDFHVFGAFRSREVVGQAYFSLINLLSMIGHRNRTTAKQRRGRKRYTFIHSFRQVPENWPTDWQDFFAGKSISPLQNLVTALLDRAGARAQAAKVQEGIEFLAAFWHNEAVPLRKAIEKTAYAGPLPIPQNDRDPLFVRARIS
jgi:excinuclease ABC subunit C